MWDWLKSTLYEPIARLFTRPEEEPPDVPEEDIPEEEIPEPEPVEIEDAEPEPVDMPEEDEEVAEAEASTDEVVSLETWQPPEMEWPAADSYEPVFEEPPNLWVGRGLTGGDATLLGPAEPDEAYTLGDDSFWGQITGWAVADSPARNRWTYSWKAIYKATAGYGGWSDLAIAVTGSNNAFNTIENMNTASDAKSPTVQGNGVDIDGADFPDGFEIQPAPIHAIVRMYPVNVGTTVEYWFSYENGIDGTCAAA